MDNGSTSTEHMVDHYVRPAAVFKRRPFLMAGIFSRSAKAALTGQGFVSGIFGTIGLFLVAWIAYELNTAWVMSHYEVVGVPVTPYEMAYSACEFGLLLFVMAFGMTLISTGRTTARLADDANVWTLGRNLLSTAAATALATAYCCVLPIFIATVSIVNRDWINNGEMSRNFVSLVVACFATYFLGYARIGFAPLIAATEGVPVRTALARSIELTRGTALKVGLLLLVSHLVWVVGYFLLVVPGIPLFEWNQLNLVAVLNRLIERSRRLEPDEIFAPVSMARPQIFTHS